MSESYARALNAAQLLELFAEESADSLSTNIQLVIESCTCELRRLYAENKSLREQIDWVQIQPDEYEQEMEAILQAAKNSYRRHMSVPHGQAVTRGDAFESHCIWAALQYAGTRAAKVLRKASVPVPQAGPDRDQTGHRLQT